MALREAEDVVDAIIREPVDDDPWPREETRPTLDANELDHLLELVEIAEFDPAVSLSAVLREFGEHPERRAAAIEFLRGVAQSYSSRVRSSPGEVG